jgi:hypothetical protein
MIVKGGLFGVEPEGGRGKKKRARGVWSKYILHMCVRENTIMYANKI